MPCWKAGDVLELCTKGSSGDTVAQELPPCCQETWIPAAWLPFPGLSHGKAGKASLCKAPNLELSASFQNWLIAWTTLPVQDSKCFLFQRIRQVKMWSVTMYLSSFMWKCMPFKSLSESSLLHRKLCYSCDSMTAWWGLSPLPYPCSSLISGIVFRLRQCGLVERVVPTTTVSFFLILFYLAWHVHCSFQSSLIPACFSSRTYIILIGSMGLPGHSPHSLRLPFQNRDMWVVRQQNHLHGW